MHIFAVLSGGNINVARDYLKDNYLILTENISQRELCSASVKFIIIFNDQQTRGMNFDSYIKAPDYYTLEDTIKACIR